MSVSNGQLANASTFNNAFVSKTANSTVSGTITQNKESVIAEIATPATPASGYGKIYFKSDGKLYQLNDSGIETQVGTGTGGGAGGVNFISNGTAEDNNTTGWAVYADAAGTSPVDGTGGSANVTNTVSATTPLVGTYSFLLAKDAANRQGQGWSYAFTIDRAYQAKVLQISFDYLVASGTFVAGASGTDSDVTVWIYDVTNAVLIQPSSIKLFSNNASIADKYQATFQTASNSTSYRLIFHVQSTSASAYTLKVDNVSVSPSTYVFGTPVTDWQSYTPTFTGFGTPTSVQFQWRRVGADLEVRGKFTSGTSTATEGRVSFPSGLTSGDTNLIPSLQHIGMAASSATAANSRTVLIEPSVTYFTFGVTTSGPLTKANGSTLFGSGETCAFFGKVPIAGWSSSVQTSDSADTRIVAAQYKGNAGGALTADVTNITFSTSNYETHGAWNGTTFTAPVGGIYQFQGMISITTSTAIDLFLWKNGVKTFMVTENRGVTTSVFGFSGTLQLNAGETMNLRSDTGCTLNNSATNHFINISRLSGPSAIAASETVAAKYYRTATQSIPNVTDTVSNLDQKEYDTHGAVTTGAAWKFLVPISGKYRISTQQQFTNAAYAANKTFYAKLRKNGTTDVAKGSVAATTGFGFYPSSAIVVDIQLNAGDYLDVTVYQDTGSAVNLTSSSIESWFCAHRIGN